MRNAEWVEEPWRKEIDDAREIAGDLCQRSAAGHLRKRFLDAQGPSRSDKAARMRRIENAKRYEAWSQGRTLSATGQRSI